MFVAAMLLMWLCFNEKPIKILFIGVAAYAMQNFASALFFFIRGLAGAPRGFSVISLVIILLVFPAVYTAGYFLFARKIKPGDILNRGRIPFLIVSTVTILVVTVLGMYSISEGIGRHNAILLFRLCCCAMALFIQFGLVEKEKTLTEKEAIAHMFTVAEKHQIATKEGIDFVNIKYHDLKKQISTLKQIDNDTEWKESIDEIEKSAMIFDSIAQTGNKSLDIVLTEKSIQCQKRQINFSYIADGKKLRFMNAIDVYSMMENALENAIESAMRIDNKEKRIIFLNIGTKGKMLFIHTENHIETALIFVNGLPVTTKEDKLYHGFGLKSIRFIAEKYGGNMEISIKEDRFVLDIFIPIPE